MADESLVAQAKQLIEDSIPHDGGLEHLFASCEAAARYSPTRRSMGKRAGCWWRSRKSRPAC
jgi:hypothetical protein